MTNYFRRWHERRRQTPAVKTDKAEEHHSARTKASSWRRRGESVKCGLVMACLTGTSPASHPLAVSTQDCMCKWEEGGDKEPEIECFCASRRQTDTSCPGQPKSRRGEAVFRQRTSSISSSTANQEFKQCVKREFLTLGWDRCRPRSKLWY